MSFRRLSRSTLPVRRIRITTMGRAPAPLRIASLNPSQALRAWKRHARDMSGQSE